jgi:hypothetical protein
MSGTLMNSSFPSENVLFSAASGQALQQGQRNALMLENQGIVNQGAQQAVSAVDQEQVGRAASFLMTLPEEQRAAAYPRVVQTLQSQGFAKNAPAQYPGHDVVAQLANAGVPVVDQYKMGLITPPGLTAAIAGANAPLPGQPGYGAPGPGASATPATAYGKGGPGSSVTVPPEYLPFYAEASKRTGIPVDVLIAQHRQESGFNPGATGAAGEIGIGQVAPATARSPGFGMTGVEPATLRDPRTNINFSADYLKARMGPNANPADPNAIVSGLHAYNGGGDPNYVANVTRYLPQPGATQQAAAAPVAPAGVAARTGGVDVAGPGAGAPGGGALPVTGPMTDQAWLDNQAKTYPDLAGPNANPTAPVPATDQPAPAAPGGAGVPVGNLGLVRTPDGNVGTPTPAPAPLPGTPPNAMGPTPSPPPQLMPAASAQPPQAAPATGTNSPQFQAALEFNRRAQVLETQYPYSPQAKAMAASLRAQAALYMQADSVTYDPVTGVGTKALTGERLNAAAPNAHYVWDEKQGSFIDTSGTHPPVTPPSPRLTQTSTGEIIQSKPGGGAQVVFTPSNPAVAAQEAAKAEGAASGKATAEALPKLIDAGRSAQAAEGNIDYGLSQLDKAKAGGIDTGYFSGAKTNIMSGLKSLGVPTDKIPFIGVDPSAVGNIQTARKTLAVVSGAILQQIIGKDSPITDSKIEAFIHAQPGIETDPDAVRRVLGWARSQFTFEREMAQSGVNEAATTGRLAPNWQAKYFKEHGFAPIYNPSTGEMQQPDGGAPGRESPPSAGAAPVVKSDADFHALPSGSVFTDPNGQQRRKP